MTSCFGFLRHTAINNASKTISFANVDFIDQPIRTYSTGMVMRLGFAIATQVEPDVLIIDEASMVDTMLFRAVLEALPETARLILVGDADQRPFMLR